MMLNREKINIMEQSMSIYVVHLPHSGVEIPKNYRDDYLLSNELLRRNIFEYADYLTDELYKPFIENFTSVINPYSRLFMDPERFFEDTKESMHTEHRLGWFYENAILEKTPLRCTTHKDEIATYYHEHHQKLLGLVENKLLRYKECIIIDCHSFSNRRYWFHKQDINLPDICIGFDEFHQDEHLVALLLEEFSEYKIGINTPYAGSLVPMKYYNKDNRVKSVMIEINKKLYLQSDNTTKSEGFVKIQNHFANIVRKLRS